MEKTIKKVLLIMLLISLGTLTYASIENIIINIETPKSITSYAGTVIHRYDLGDVECFTSKVGMSCLRK